MMTDAEDAHRRVLVIDDHPAIHEDFRKLLGPELPSPGHLAASAAALFGDTPRQQTVKAAAAPVFRVDCAHQGQEGVEMARCARVEHRPYAVAFVDARMPPGWNGIETITKLWEQDPDVLVVLCTAYSDYSWREIRTQLTRPEHLVILKKPFDVIEVQQLVEGLTEKWRLARAERRRLQQLEQMISERNRDAQAMQSIDAVLAVGGESAATANDRFGRQTQEARQRRDALQRALEEALRHDQLSLCYQPLVEIATRSVVSVEALLRWQHPQLGAISPAEFIPIAEETRLIVPIGEFVLRSACAQLVRWECAGVPVVPIAVNVSAVQLESGKIADDVRRALSEEGAPPHRLALELTESTLMENASRHTATLQSLRADGVTIQIDDFGTGYSSLSCLRHLPIDTIKIDRSFITHLATSRTDEAIVAAILAMAQSLDLRAVAEGVETPAQLEILARHGCEIAQGYYFCRPLAANECEQLLTDLAGEASFSDTLRLRKRKAFAQ